MTAVICMLRGVNVGGHNKIGMDALREICTSLKVRTPQTYIQSGNVVFGTTDKDLIRLARCIEDGIEKRFRFRPSVILRTVSEMRDVIVRNPFAARNGLDPGKLVVFFLADSPGAEVRNKLLAINVGSEELHTDGRELFIYFPDGQGRSKLPPVLDRTLKMHATARNWNTVTKLLALADDLEAAR